MLFSKRLGLLIDVMSGRVSSYSAFMPSPLPPLRRCFLLLLALILVALQTLGAHGLSLCVCTGGFVARSGSCHETDASLAPVCGIADGEPTPGGLCEECPCSTEDAGHCADHLALDDGAFGPARNGDLAHPGGDGFPLLQSLLNAFPRSLIQGSARVRPSHPGWAHPPSSSVSVARVRVLRI